MEAGVLRELGEPGQGSESGLVSLGSRENLRIDGRLRSKESKGNLGSLESVRGEQCFFPKTH